jgi:hypothetical protein
MIKRASFLANPEKFGAHVVREILRRRGGILRDAKISIF